MPFHSTRLKAFAWYARRYITCAFLLCLLVFPYSPHAMQTSSCFLIDNEDRPNAKIIAVLEASAGQGKYSSQTALGLIRTYTQIDESDPQAVVNAGWSLLVDSLNVSGNVSTFLTMADSNYEGGIFSKAMGSDAMKGIGIAMAVAQLAVDLYSGDTQAAIINGCKNTFSVAVSFVGSPALQMSMSGLFALDYALTKMGEYSKTLRMDNVRKVYFSYNDGLRSEGQWESLIRSYQAELIKRKHPDRIGAVLEADIDRFSRRFWEDYAKDPFKVVLDSDVGNRLLNLSAEEREQLRQDYILHLRKLVSQICLKIAKRSRDTALRNLEKELEKQQRFLNRTVQFRVYDTKAGDKGSSLAGATVRFEGAKGTGWSFVLDNAGSGTFSMTRLGHIRAGMPMQLAVYPEGAKKAVLTKTFRISGSTVEVPLEGGNVDVLDTNIEGSYKGKTIATEIAGNFGKTKTEKVKSRPLAIKVTKAGNSYKMVLTFTGASETFRPTKFVDGIPSEWRFSQTRGQITKTMIVRTNFEQGVCRGYMVPEMTRQGVTKQAGKIPFELTKE